MRDKEKNMMGLMRNRVESENPAVLAEANCCMWEHLFVFYGSLCSHATRSQGTCPRATRPRGIC